MKRTSLQQTFTVSITLFTICVIGAVAWFGYQQGKSVLIGELQRHGLSLAENLAYNSEYGLLFSDIEGLKKLVDGVSQNQDVLYVVIMTAEGGIIAEHGLYQYSRLERITQKRFVEYLQHIQAEAEPKLYDAENNDGIYDIFAPVYFTPEEGPANSVDPLPSSSVSTSPTPQQELLGVVVVGISFDRGSKLLRFLQLQILGLTLFIVVLALIVARFLVMKVSEPIEKLATGTRRIARGDLTQEVEINTQDEIGELAHSFNFMMHELRYSRQELELWAQTLEQRVQERTKEIQQKNQQLTELVESMKRIQEQLVHSEKMASLGQLVAGIAHEINNPVNFISSNISPLKQYIADVKQILRHYEKMRGLHPEQYAEIEKLKASLDFEFLLEDLDDLIRDIETGAIRIKDIVQDLRNFSRLDEAELKTIDIHQSLDTTLNLLGHLYENRITVHKQYGDIPPVECYAGQLNQVFMNILANAAQAFETKGNVWITTSLQTKDDHPGASAWLHVTFRDDGRGIPEDVLPKIFDPFFTTKDVGEGTGLGLSIAYGIIEKHRGELNVSSSIGEGTEFQVEIPVKLSQELRWREPVEKTET
nr:putative signal transduction histidine kinase [uncultured bacterium]